MDTTIVEERQVSVQMKILNNEKDALDRVISDLASRLKNILRDVEPSLIESDDPIPKVLFSLAEEIRQKFRKS